MLKYKGKVLTDEQEDHVHAIMSGQNYAIQAPPGSGKTFLLLAIARQLQHSGNGLSISFNKLLAKEASTKFHKKVDCRTGHSLAYRAIGYKYRSRLKKITGKLLAETQDIGNYHDYNSASNKGYIILNTIRNYCYSSSMEITKDHIPSLLGINQDNYLICIEDLIHHSKVIFNEMTNQASNIPITHDIYLKLWALTKPKLNYDYIFFDEYQDSNPVISQVIKDQDCQKIFVGDAYQQIYSWRGAINALQSTDLNKLQITKSFRFGQPIADMCNKIITSYYPYDHPYISFNGNDEVISKISYTPNLMDCIICRTNNGVIVNTINALNQGQKVHILGGTKPLSMLINAIHTLKSNKPTNHPELFLFKTYKEMEEYAKSPMGGDLKPTIKLIEAYGKKRLLGILGATKEKSQDADITITTAHKSKGLEWSSVRLANDFKVPNLDDGLPSQEETNILYVAASRALHNLDLSQCASCSPKSFELAKELNQPKEIEDNSAGMSNVFAYCN
ncbi:MAG TPA: UvrD-helicase domain-containing protein [Candidatus Izemoplasmatales bacterium]|nr:UvrD-helicase domain-containing protein [Candidatus Izemoplasmatales bacterium]